MDVNSPISALRKKRGLTQPKRAIIKPIETENKNSNIDEIIVQHFDNSMLFRA